MSGLMHIAGATTDRRIAVAMGRRWDDSLSAGEWRWGV